MCRGSSTREPFKCGCVFVGIAANKEQNDVMSKRRRIDRVAATAARLAVVTTVIYFLFAKYQVADRPFALFKPVSRGVATYSTEHMYRMPIWNVTVTTVLVIGTALVIYGARITSPYRRTALLLAGLVLTWLGILAISSFGALIILAGLLCLVAVWRRERPTPNA
jgi:hypothetical protein